MTDTSASEMWFYRDADGKKGPVSKADLLERLLGRVIPPESPVWRSGMETWVPAAELAEFRPACLASRAPIAPRRRVRPEIAIAGVLALISWGAMRLLSFRSTGLHSLSGVVGFEGHGIERGTIIFEPVPGESEKRSAVIRSGSFFVPSIEGLRQGQSYILRIYGYRKIESPPQDAAEESVVDRQQQFVPDDFNKQSRLLFEATKENLKKGLALKLP